MKHDELIYNMFRLECQLFIKTDSYRLIKQAYNKKCLEPDERQLLNADIHSAFTGLIETVRETCPNLSDEDITFCCLSKLGLDNSTICFCMGNVSKQVITQRKYRIKKKMKKVKCDYLFEMIFRL